MRTTHDNLLLMFEVKNTTDLDMAAINQTAVYLGDGIGFIVTREPPSESVLRKTYTVWNDSGQGRKAILILTDAQLFELLDLRCKDGLPTKWLQKHYRAFRTGLRVTRQLNRKQPAPNGESADANRSTVLVPIS